jgi:histidinol-phosphate phosphatase family protein
VVQRYFQDGRRWGMSIDYSVTDVHDDTGRRLKLAAHLLDPTFLLLYCDNYWPMQMEKMWERFRKADAPAMITIYRNTDGYTKNSIKMDDAGYVVEYDKTGCAPGLQGVEISYAIMRKSVVDLISDDNVNLEATVYPTLASRKQLLGYATEHRYYSIGSLARLPLTQMFFSNRPTIFLDRDGVLNKKPRRAEYVAQWEEFRWLPGAKEALRLLNQAGYRVIIISNQAGVARGAMTCEALAVLHRQMYAEVQDSGGRIDAIYYCPHGWDAGCECRKPKPGLLFQAQRDFNLNLSRVLFVGDDERDLQAAAAAGCQGVSISGDAGLLDVVTQVLRYGLEPEQKANALDGQQRMPTETVAPIT